jgi:propionyl-CoA synthetase
MEEIVASEKAVTEWAVLGIYCELKVQKPFALIVLKSAEELDSETTEKEIVQDVRREIGLIAYFKMC